MNATATYTMILDPKLIEAINAAIEVEKQSLKKDPCSQEWFALRGELSERLEEIGVMLVWEFKQLPF